MSVELYIDGTQIGGSHTGSSTRRLNGISTAEIVVPTASAVGGIGSKMKVVVDGELEHHGRCLHVTDDAKEDTMYSTYQSSTPMEMWQHRPARDGAASPTPGNLINPSVFTRAQYAPQILYEMLVQSMDDSDPNLGEGTLFTTFGTIEQGVSDMSGAPTNFPMTIAECASLLMSTGALDCVEIPIDDGTNLVELSLYNGLYGVDRSGEIIFQYAMGANNCTLRQVEDAKHVTNKLYYNFGPRPTTTRYKANITADDPCLDQGNLATVLARRNASRALLGVRMNFQEFDVDVLYREDHGEEGGECNPPLDPTRMLYRRRWLLESYFRAIAHRMVYVTPTRNTFLTDFGIGDLVGVEAGPALRGGFPFQKMRIYGKTTAWDQDVAWLNELETSPNQEGLS